MALEDTHTAGLCLERYLMVFHDANRYKQQALPNSGNPCGQLGGWTFLDMHTRAKL